MSDDMLGCGHVTAWRCLHENPLPEVEEGMTNYDHSVDDGLAKAIADGQHMADYSGWNFHAYVYLGAEGLYVADVHVFHHHAGYATAHGLRDLMAEVSDEWGSE